MRIGTRRSKLARIQAERVAAGLLRTHHWPAERIEIIAMQTTGDKITDRPLADVGGKGLFCKELQEALLEQHIDLAVHSMKDMETALPEGLAIGCVLEREDPHDAFISLTYSSFAALPQGAMIGTSSVRRKAQLLHLRPDLRVVDFRGNVPTRLDKLKEGQVDGTFLSVAGLFRLEMQDAITEIMPLETMIPAAAQGAIATEIRADDTSLHMLLAPLHHAPSARQVSAERALLDALDGDCRTPIGAYAAPDETARTLTLHGMLASSDGAHYATAEATLPFERDNDTEILRLAEHLRQEIRRAVA